ncbi:MAG: SprB repeat-containing protein, partial [Bacteroidota bacterium]
MNKQITKPLFPLLTFLLLGLSSQAQEVFYMYYTDTLHTEIYYNDILQMEYDWSKLLPYLYITGEAVETDGVCNLNQGVVIDSITNELNFDPLNFTDFYYQSTDEFILLGSDIGDLNIHMFWESRFGPVVFARKVIEKEAFNGTGFTGEWRYGQVPIPDSLNLRKAMVRLDDYQFMAVADSVFIYDFSEEIITNFLGESYEIFILNERNLGQLPQGLKALGDVTKRGDQFLGATETHLFEFDTLNLGTSQIFMPLPEGTEHISNLTTLEHGCGRTITYAIDQVGILDSSILYEIDMERRQFIRLCGFEGKGVEGMTSRFEYDTMACQSILDLDGSTTTRIDFNQANVCSNKVSIVDSLVHVFSSLPIDALQIELVTPPDGVEELLLVEDWDGMAPSQQDSSTLFFQLDGQLSALEVEELLQSVYYYNEGIDFEGGIRDVWVRMYVDGEEWSAKSTFCVEMPDPYVVNSQNPGCTAQNDGQITIDLQYGKAPHQINWDNGFEGNIQEQLPAGTYSFSITDAKGRSFRDSVTLSLVEIFEVAIAAASDSICGNEGTLSALVTGSDSTYIYEWSDGATTAERTGLAAGSYELKVSNANGCIQTAQYE